MLVVLFFIIAAWSVWRYYDLKKRIDHYINEIRDQDKPLPTDIKGIENLSNAIASLKAIFDLRLSTLDSDNARLATVLDQLTDGVLIVDSRGRSNLQIRRRADFSRIQIPSTTALRKSSVIIN